MAQFKIIISLSFLLLSANAFGEVYRWVDANGKVHFSDEPAQDIKAEAVAPLQKSVGFHEYETNSARAIEAKNLRPKPSFLFGEFEFALLASEKRERIGSYFFTRECRAADALYWPDFYTSHKGFLPQRAELFSALQSSFHRYGYGLRKSEQLQAKTAEQISALYLPYSVSAQFVNLRLDVCTRQGDIGLVQLDGENFSTHDYSQALVSFDVQWRIEPLGDDAKPDANQEVLYFQTKAYADFREATTKNRAPVSDYIEFALAEAVRQLLAQERLFEGVLAGKPVPAVPAEVNEFQQVLAEPMFSAQSKILIGVIIALLVLSVLQRLVLSLK